MRLPDQRPNEEILLVVRKHPIVYIRLIFIYTVMLILPVLLFLWGLFTVYQFSEFGKTVTMIFASEYFLMVLALTLITWLNEEFDLFIITNERLIDVTQISFMQRTVASTPLSMIQDCTSDVHGFLATILNYGTVDVQTAAGEASQFNIERVPQPATLSRRILDIVHGEHHPHPHTSQEFNENEDPMI